jgi:hypothetical protein
VLYCKLQAANEFFAKISCDNQIQFERSSGSPCIVRDAGSKRARNVRDDMRGKDGPNRSYQVHCAHSTKSAWLFHGNGIEDFGGRKDPMGVLTFRNFWEPKSDAELPAALASKLYSLWKVCWVAPGQGVFWNTDLV